MQTAVEKELIYTSNMKAWMFFLNSNDYYVYMLIGAYKNLLDTKTKYPVFCAVTEDVSYIIRNLLKRIGIQLVDLEKISVKSVSSLDYYQKALQKLAILNLKGFDKIIYLDSDLWIKDNIDELFDKPHLTAVINQAPKAVKPYILGQSVFCSGLFVWDYKAAKPIDLTKLPENMGWHDQSVLNYFNQDWGQKPELHLDYHYGLMNSLSDGINISDVKILHFVNRPRNTWPFREKTKLTSNNKFIYEWCQNINNALKYFNIKELEPLHLTNLIK